MSLVSRRRNGVTHAHGLAQLASLARACRRTAALLLGAGLLFAACHGEQPGGPPPPDTIPDDTVIPPPPPPEIVLASGDVASCGQDWDEATARIIDTIPGTVAALGDLAYDSLVKSADAAGIKVVANERYARTDSSVAGQVLKIVAQRPDAVFAGNSGTPGALPYLALAERNYKGRIYGTHGLINADFVRVGGKAIEGLEVPSGPVLVADQLPDSNPIKKVSMAFRASYQKTNGAIPTDAFSSYTYDAYLLRPLVTRTATG